MELFYVDGFAFSTKEEYNLASHEAKNVSSIRAQLNWENKDSVMLVYRRLAAKGIFVTPVGLSFIKELRTVLVERFSVEESSLPMIRVVDHKTKGRDQDSFTKEQLLKDNQKKPDDRDRRSDSCDHWNVCSNSIFTEFQLLSYKGEGPGSIFVVGRTVK